MKRFNCSGFTIIETMLVLAVTGALITTLLIGVGSSINAQRYRDSVVSLQSILQKQYSEVANVNNTASGVCKPGVPRGQSECVIIGRYITSNDDQKLTIKTVYLDKMPSTIAGQSDTDILKSGSGVTFASFSTFETYEVEWGVLLEPKKFSILIVRSPSSGVIRTFINDSVLVTNIQSLITAYNLAVGVKICVQPNGLSGGTPSAVIVNAGATNASGVETKGDDSGC